MLLHATTCYYMRDTELVKTRWAPIRTDVAEETLLMNNICDPNSVVLILQLEGNCRVMSICEVEKSAVIYGLAVSALTFRIRQFVSIIFICSVNLVQIEWEDWQLHGLHPSKLPDCWILRGAHPSVYPTSAIEFNTWPHSHGSLTSPVIQFQFTLIFVTNSCPDLKLIVILSSILLFARAKSPVSPCQVAHFFRHSLQGNSVMLVILITTMVSRTGVSTGDTRWQWRVVDKV